MPAYVGYYGPEPKPDMETPEDEKKRLAGPPIVQYLDTPTWTFPAKEIADVELGILRRMNVSVPEYQHFCGFSVEELPDGQFAIVCLSHPNRPPK